MITPQLTEQYGQVLRVSVVREIFSACVCAYAGFRSKPRIVAVTPPTVVILRKSRREGFMAASLGGSRSPLPGTMQPNDVAPAAEALSSERQELFSIQSYCLERKDRAHFAAPRMSRARGNSAERFQQAISRARGNVSFLFNERDPLVQLIANLDGTVIGAQQAIATKRV